MLHWCSIFLFIHFFGWWGGAAVLILFYLLPCSSLGSLDPHSLLACPGCAPPGEYKSLQYPYSFGLGETCKNEEWSFEIATVLQGF